MSAFTHDVEVIELTEAELADFGRLVQFSCHAEMQHKLASWLSRVPGPQPCSVQEFAQRQVQKMWRAQLRVLAGKVPREVMTGELDQLIVLGGDPVVCAKTG